MGLIFFGLADLLECVGEPRVRYTLIILVVVGIFRLLTGWRAQLQW